MNSISQDISDIFVEYVNQLLHIGNQLPVSFIAITSQLET